MDKVAAVRCAQRELGRDSITTVGIDAATACSLRESIGSSRLATSAYATESTREVTARVLLNARFGQVSFLDFRGRNLHVPPARDGDSGAT